MWRVVFTEHVWLGEVFGNTEQGTGRNSKEPLRVAAGLGSELLSVGDAVLVS